MSVRGPGRSKASAPRCFAVAFALLDLLSAAGCRNGGGAPDADGGMDGPGPTSARLAIAVTGCAELVTASRTCRGAPPLALSFAPVGSPDVTRFLWTFGDGSPAVTERAPRHTYVLPGSYSVGLVGAGGSFGQTMATNVEVIVEPLPVGFPCDIAAQCADGLACICGAGAGCSSAFTRGLCSASCERGSCAVGSTCVAIALDGGGTGTDAGAPQPVCLGDCANDGDCSAGLVCVGARSGGNVTPPSWTAACLPAGAYKRIGDACRGPNGALDDRACASDTCADVGALGVCSASCDEDPRCPLGGACVRLGDGRRLCLETCHSRDDCGLDPLLDCAAVDKSNATDGGSATTVCSPKVCASEADCAPAGRCAADAHCTRK